MTTWTSLSFYCSKMISLPALMLHLFVYNNFNILTIIEQIKTQPEILIYLNSIDK